MCSEGRLKRLFYTPHMPDALTLLNPVSCVIIRFQTYCKCVYMCRAFFLYTQHKAVIVAQLPEPFLHFKHVVNVLIYGR